MYHGKSIFNSNTTVNKLQYIIHPSQHFKSNISKVPVIKERQKIIDIVIVDTTVKDPFILSTKSVHYLY
jgi:hypothetical protein